MKLIAVLRNPVDRAYSNFMQHVLQGRERAASFELALEAEQKRKEMDWQPFWFYRELGFYGEQLSRYMSIFSLDQIKILLYEEVCGETHNIVKSIFQFLDGDPHFTVRILQSRNTLGIPKNEMLNSFLTKSNIAKKLLNQLFLENRGANYGLS